MDCLSLRDPLFFASQLTTGVATGGIYALVALGLVLIYKSSDVINFAQATCCWSAPTSAGRSRPLGCRSRSPSA